MTVSLTGTFLESSVAMTVVSQRGGPPGMEGSGGSGSKRKQEGCRL